MSLQAYDLRDPASVLKVVRHSNVVINLVGRDYETRSGLCMRYMVVRGKGQGGGRGETCVLVLLFCVFLQVLYGTELFSQLGVTTGDVIIKSYCYRYTTMSDLCACSTMPLTFPGLQELQV